jgi:hypothetical protein
MRLGRVSTLTGMARAAPSDEACTRPRDSQRARLYRAEGTAQLLEDAFDRERVRWTLAEVPA